MSCDDWQLTVGEIVAPFGRIGEVKVRLETDFPDRFARLNQVCLRFQNGAATLYTVEKVRLHKGQALLKLRGVESIDDAETLRNTLVQIPASMAVKLPPTEFYIHDVIGCTVFLEDGTQLGVLEQILRSTANDVYLIRLTSGKELLLPALQNVVLLVDAQARRIVVRPSPGLMSDDPAEIA